MVIGMATKKVTVTIDEVLLAKIRDLVVAGVAPSVSAFVAHAVALSLDDVAGWKALLADALTDTGGALTAEELAWADGVLQRPGTQSAA